MTVSLKLSAKAETLAQRLGLCYFGSVEGTFELADVEGLAGSQPG